MHVIVGNCSSDEMNETRNTPSISVILIGWRVEY